jgi:two-component system chemotaxis response regulator CheY
MTDLRALVVDDSKAMRRSIVYALERKIGIACVEAEDGADALKKLGQERFDLVLTDINMPLMDGLKLIRAIRQDEVLRTIPIVVISTERGEDEKARAMELGASAYLVKPVQAGTVVQTVKGLLQLA